MLTINVYANYGVPDHEGYVVWSMDAAEPTAERVELVTILPPEGIDIVSKSHKGIHVTEDWQTWHDFDLVRYTCSDIPMSCIPDGTLFPVMRPCIVESRYEIPSDALGIVGK